MKDRLAETVSEKILEIKAFGLKNPNEEPITLHSGGKSSGYFNLKSALQTNPILRKSLATYLLDILPCEACMAISGVAVGGAGIITSLSDYSEIPSLIIRQEHKKYGLKDRIIGLDTLSEDTINVIAGDEMTTSGNSLIMSAKLLREAGFNVDTCIVILSMDTPMLRRNLKNNNLRLLSLVTANDVCDVALEKNLFPENSIRNFRKQIGNSFQ